MIPFIQTLWSKPNRIDKVLKDVDRSLSHKYQVPFTCLTYGDKLHGMLLDKGINSVCICPEDRMFPPEEEFAHKLFTWVKASEMYDKWFFKDWDVLLTKPLPLDFEDYYKDKIFQGNLRQYVRVQNDWRKEHRRKLICASWLYFGNPNVPKEIYSIWENELKRNHREERAVSYWCDMRCPNKIFSLDYYRRNFEPRDFCLKNSSVFKDRERNTLWQHYTGNRRD